ncbi:MAG TPA: hypothetical protein PKG79_10345 [Propioniciclava tarda]|nr:hypothetical protein [Propioniciclava tarda]
MGLIDMGLGHLGLMMIGLLFVGSFIFSSSFRGLFRRGAEIMSINDLEGRAFVGQHLAVGYGFSSLIVADVALALAQIFPTMSSLCLAVGGVGLASMLAFFLLAQVVYWFAWPKWLIPRDLRGDPGQWQARRNR